VVAKAVIQVVVAAVLVVVMVMMEVAVMAIVAAAAAAAAAVVVIVWRRPSTCEKCTAEAQKLHAARAQRVSTCSGYRMDTG
jgi:ABC-type bacteriocin/lantibiotic exporter with double-glycine peptidase domain